MGRRSRARERPADGARAPRPAPARARTGLDRVRKTLGAYLLAALAVAVLTLLGIAVLGGTLGPFVVLAATVLAGGLLHRAATARLAGAALDDHDRTIQTLAGGLLLISVVLALAGAVLSLLA